MSWIGRFGKSQRSLIPREVLYKMIDEAKFYGLKCTSCQGETTGVVHCKDCGWTRRFCDNHRPDEPSVMHMKRLHAAICEPMNGST